MPPYAKTMHPRIRRGHLYRLVDGEGAALGVGQVEAFHPDIVTVTESGLVGIAQRNPIHADQIVALPADAAVVVRFASGERLHLPSAWVGDETLGYDAIESEEPIRMTLVTLFQMVGQRSRAGEAVAIRSNDDHTRVELEWTSRGDGWSGAPAEPRGLAVLAIDNEGNAPRMVAEMWTAPALGRRAAREACAQRVQAVAKALEAARRDADRAQREARVRAGWPRFELYRRSWGSDGGCVSAVAPHPAATYNYNEYRWEIAAPSLDALLTETLADVAAPLRIVLRGKGAPPDVLTVVEIDDVDDGSGDD